MTIVLFPSLALEIDSQGVWCLCVQGNIFGRNNSEGVVDGSVEGGALWDAYGLPAGMWSLFLLVPVSGFRTQSGTHSSSVLAGE